METSVYPRFPLAAYILNNPSLTDGKDSDARQVDVLAVGAFYGKVGMEKFPKWFHGKATIPPLSHYARPNFFGLDGSNGHVTGGGISFSWYCRAMFRRKLHSVMTSSIKHSSSSPLKGGDEVDDDEEVDNLFEMLALIQSAHNVVYGGSSLHNKKYGKNDPIWLRHVKAKHSKLVNSKEAGRTRNNTSSSNHCLTHGLLWSKWGSQIETPSFNELNDDADRQHNVDRWSEFETTTALLSANGKLLSCFEKGDLEGVCKIWGFDSDSVDGTDSDVNSDVDSASHNHSDPIMIYPGWKGSNKLKGYNQIKEYYESNFMARQVSNGGGKVHVVVFIDEIDTHIDSHNYLCGTTSLNIRVESLVEDDGSDSGDVDTSKFVGCLMISNQFIRSAIGEPFQLIYQHSSLTQ